MNHSLKHRGPSFKVPNSLILNGAISHSARRMGAVLYSRRNHLGVCTRSLANLAKLARCSVPTARKALEELERAGFVTRTRNYKYNERLARLVYGQYTYRCDLSFKGGFTFIPWSLFHHELKSSAFAFCLYLYLRAGNKSKAFPSLKNTCRDLWMGKDTLCRARRMLEAVGLIFVLQCRKVNRAFSKSSYFFLCRAKVQQENSGEFHTLLSPYPIQPSGIEPRG